VITSDDADLADGWAALRRGDGAAAQLVFAQVPPEERSGAVLEGLARAAYLQLDFRGAVDALEAAYARHREDGDAVGAGDDGRVPRRADVRGRARPGATPRRALR